MILTSHVFVVARDISHVIVARDSHEMTNRIFVRSLVNILSRFANYQTKIFIECFNTS